MANDFICISETRCSRTGDRNNEIVDCLNKLIQRIGALEKNRLIFAAFGGAMKPISAAMQR